MQRKIVIEKESNGKTKVSVNGYDITPYISKFSLSQGGGCPLPVLTLTIPATHIQMPDDFWAALEIKKV